MGILAAPKTRGRQSDLPADLTGDLTAVADVEGVLAAGSPDEPIEGLAGGHPHKEKEKLIKFIDERDKNGYHFE